MTGARRFHLSLRLRSSVVALVSGLCSAVTAQAQWPAALDSYQPPSEQELAAARWAEESFEGTEAIPGQPLTWTSAGAPFVWGEAGAATGVYQVPEDGGKLVRIEEPLLLGQA